MTTLGDESMDHPSLNKGLPLVSYVEGRYAYDDLGFVGFPSRKGISDTFEEEPLIGDLCEFTLQWCFFGLLAEFLRFGGIRLDKTDFIYETPGEADTVDSEWINISEWVTIRLLPDYLLAWIGLAGRQYGGWRALWYGSNIQQSLKAANDFVQNVREKLNEDPEFSDEDMENVLLLIDILGAGITLAVRDATLTDLPFKWGPSALLKERCMINGWCPCDFATFAESWDPLTLCLLSTMERQNLREDHGRCSERHCLLTMVDEATYETKHTVEDCHCSQVALDETENEKLWMMLRNGQIPIITFTSNNNDCEQGSSVRVMPSRPTAESDVVPYAAISHVWADGLGNPRQNSLPRCQMARLQNLVNAHARPGQAPLGFWIDTLCVPITQPLRNTAITLMRETYEEADAVLVLDSLLLATSIDEGFVMCMLKTTCCRWLRRLWTYQEACLSKKLHFQLRDGSFEYPDFAGEYAKMIRGWFDAAPERLAGSSARRELLRGTNGTKATLHDPLFRVCGEVFIQLYALKAPFEDHFLFMMVCRSLIYRSTSKAADEGICLSALLRQSPADVVQLDPEDRVRHVITSLRAVPSDILFIRQPCYPEDGSRWIPRTLLGPADQEVGSPGWDPNAYHTSEGLMVKYPGYLLELPENPFFAEQATRQALIFYVRRWWWRRHYTCGVALLAGCSRTWSSFKCCKVGLILIRPPVLTVNYGLHGVLVTFRREERNTLFVRREENVDFALVEYSSDTVEGDTSPIFAKMLPSTQKWCVG